MFAGLGQEDFFTWSKDHVVYRNVYKKAAKGCRSLVQCEPELACSAMAECQVNDGLMIFCQLVVGEKLAFDPVAQRLFDNTLNYAADYQVSRKQTAVVAEAQAAPLGPHSFGCGPEVRPEGRRGGRAGRPQVRNHRRPGHTRQRCEPWSRNATCCGPSPTAADT